jgi:hypothetical protein
MKKIVNSIRSIIMFPLIPAMLCITFIAGWIIKKHNEIPEDLENQLNGVDKNLNPDWNSE